MNMKKHCLSFLIMIVSLVVFTGCKKDEVTPSVEEQQLQKLSGTWKPGSVQVDGTDISSDYTNFKITFFKDGSTTKFATTYPGNAFKTSLDSWSFVAGSQGSKITRTSDNVQIAVQFDQANLVLAFTIAPTPTGGRVSGLSGNFVFRLVKE
jgi:hypothetical protein